MANIKILTARRKVFLFLLGLFFCLAWAAFSPRTSSANPEYARATGKACVQCHGGGEVAGQFFSSGQPFGHGDLYHRSRPAALPDGPSSRPSARSQGRFLTGSISQISAIEWFGAILCLLLAWNRTRPLKQKTLPGRNKSSVLFP